MANLNKVFLIGRLTKDPELRYTPGGTPVAEFGLAVSRQYQDSNGEKKESTVFMDLVVWGKRGEICNEYLSKGRQIFVEGRLEQSIWETQDGQKRSKHRVVVENFQFLDFGQKGSGGPPPKESKPSKAPEPELPPEMPSFLQDKEPGTEDDEIPF